MEKRLRAPARPLSRPSDTFVALDFETADQGRDSACAVAAVRVAGGRIAARYATLIRPPRKRFVFTYIHGITWEHVADSPTFDEIWPALSRFMRGASFLAAHNASFDRSVMQACCDVADVPAPDSPYVCTVRLARDAWGIRPTTLPDVCRHLALPLRHHDAVSDAEACAQIVMRAMSAGVAV